MSIQDHHPDRAAGVDHEHERVREALTRQFERVLRDRMPGRIEPDQTMHELGVTSLDSVQAIAAAQRDLGVRIPMQALGADMTIEALTQTFSRAVRRREREERLAAADRAADRADDPYEHTLDAFALGSDVALTEVEAFAAWRTQLTARDTYPFESPHRARLVFSNYDYLGYARHPRVVTAAKEALDTYGLGAAASPVIGGTLPVHRELERGLVDFFGDARRAVSLFSSGFGANLGTVSAIVRPGHLVVCDRSAHVSILDGAKLSGAQVRYFEHNDPDDLERVLRDPRHRDTRVLVCVEGVYSADGDRGRIAEIAAVTKRHDALLLVDEAHSMLVAGDNGRGVSEEQGVLEQVDLLVLTMSKAFGGVGGALWAKEPVARYVNWYARCRAFSCALDPAVAGGLVEVTRLAAGADGAARRRRLHRNAARLREALAGRVDLGPAPSWVVPVIFGDDRRAIPITDWLRRRGLDAGVLAFPAVPTGEARLRLFVTSEHTAEAIDAAAALVLEAAEHFGFARGEER